MSKKANVISSSNSKKKSYKETPQYKIQAARRNKAKRLNFELKQNGC